MKSIHIRYKINIQRHGTITSCLRTSTVPSRHILARTIAQLAVDAVAMLPKAVRAESVTALLLDVFACCLAALCERLSSTVSHSLIKARIGSRMGQLNEWSFSALQSHRLRNTGRLKLVGQDLDKYKFVNKAETGIS